MAAPLVFLAVTGHPEGAPLEVAWVAENLSAGEHWLVSPAPEWAELPCDDDLAAEAGLDPERLEAEGRDPRRIAARLAEDLGGCTVACAAPAETQALLDRLYEVTPLSCPLVLRDADGLRRLTHGEPDEAAFLRARAAAGLRPGRALDTAAGLAVAHGLAAGAAAETLGKRARALLEDAG